MRKYKRRIVEFCCGGQSLIGNLAPADCEVVRLTIEDDLTTQSGLDKALAAVSDPSMPTLLFGALPCTGGSALQYINWQRGPDTQKKIRNHWLVFRRLWRNFRITAERCILHGGQIAIEWPRACRYWHERSVKSFLAKHAMHLNKLDGCMYNLRSVCPSTHGQLLRKPWTIASTSTSFSRLCRLCDHDRSVEPHTPTQGKDTRIGEGYTPELVKEIHIAWELHNQVNDKEKQLQPK